MKYHGIRKAAFLLRTVGLAGRCAMLLAAVLVFLPSRAVAWTSEIVDTDFQDGMAQIVLDSSGNPHLLYERSDGIWYAYWDGAWNRSNVDSATGRASLALDSSDQPHISFDKNGNLYYAYYSGGWITAQVDPAAGEFNSIDINNSGEPCIAYRTSSGYLYYARFNGSSWIKEKAESWPRDPSGHSCSLAHDSLNQPHVGYLWGQGVIPMALRHCYYDGITWQTDNPGYEVRNLGFGTSIAIDSADNVYIAHAQAAACPYFYLSVAIYDGVSWRNEVVDGTSPVGINVGMTLDAGENIHCAYLRTRELDSQLIHSYWDGAVWVREVVSDGICSYNYADVAVDSTGKVYITSASGSPCSPPDLLLFQGQPSAPTPTRSPTPAIVTGLIIDKGSNKATALVGDTLTYTMHYGYQTQAGGGGNKADIIWIIDGSSSMGNNQQDLADNAASFLAMLPGIDTQLGVVRMSEWGANCDSDPVGIGGGFQSPCLGTADTTGVQAEFSTMVTSVGASGGGWEFGLYGAQQTLQHYTFRADAQKVFILVSDDCPGPAQTDACSNPEEVSLRETIDVMIDNDVIVYSIIDPGFGCTGAYWEDWGITAYTGGTWGDINTADWSATLGAIGDDIREKVASVDAILYDTLPGEVTYSTSVPVPDGFGPPVYWDLGTLSSGDRGSITLYLEVTGLGDGYIDNDALITSVDAQPVATPAPSVVLVTRTSTFTDTHTPTISPTISPTSTITQTLTISPTSTISATHTPTPTITPTSSFTSTPEYEDIVVYPNPYDPDEAFGGTLKFKGLPDGAKVSIYTVSGELVQELTEESGSAYWDGKSKAGSLVSMGSYVYVIRIGKETVKRGKVVVQR